MLPILLRTNVFSHTDSTDLQRLDELDADDEAAAQMIEVGPDAVVASFSDEDEDDINDD